MSKSIVSINDRSSYLSAAFVGKNKTSSYPFSLSSLYYLSFSLCVFRRRHQTHLFVQVMDQMVTTPCVHNSKK